MEFLWRKSGELLDYYGYDSKYEVIINYSIHLHWPDISSLFRVVENRWSVVWEPGQYTTLASWYPLDGGLGLTHSNQSASHVSKNRELWLPFLPRLVSQSEVGTSFGQGEGCLGRGWWVLFTRGFAVHAQDVLEPLAEWFYATEYISSASLAFRDPRRWIVVD